MNKSMVAVVKTSPKTILEDYKKVMEMTKYRKVIRKNRRTILKLNLSWNLFYPACSSPPWQVEGVLRTLVKDRYKKIIAVENKTVVTNVIEGCQQNKWKSIFKKYGIDFLPLYNTKWVDYKPKHDLLILDKLFDEK